MATKMDLITKVIKVNIYTPDWIDMVFVGKNHEYGAYQLRKDSSKRHMLALLFASVLFVAAIAGPGFIKSILPERAVKEESRVTVLSTIDLKEMNKADEIVREMAPPPPPVRNTVKFTPPVIKPDEEVPEEQEDLKSQKDLAQSNAVVGGVDFDKGTDDQDAEVATTSNIVDDAPEGGFLIVEQMPEFPGGTNELLKYLSKNLVYPVSAQENGIQGTVYLRFVIGRDGKVSKIVVVRSLNKACDAEAIRVVESMPSWKPGKQGGREVPVAYTLPIRFTLQ